MCLTSYEIVMRSVFKGKEREARLGTDYIVSLYNLHFKERELQKAWKTGRGSCLLTFYPEYQVVLD